MENISNVPGFGFPSNKTSKNEPSTNLFSGLKMTKSKKGGGFQVMGLSTSVLQGITRRGYKIPTPIQRKTIPLILEGRDVVAMAKTGSGKTACFLIPLFEKLKRRDVSAGARALILSPTRELAVQTFKFIKELGKFMDLKAILVLGGDPMAAQFSAIHTCPDVIVATPGRFLHLCVEMDLKLTSVQYVVFDEADRLFEMGFGQQLNETINRLSGAKQIVMFSATLPKLLVDFAKAGLSDPVLIRLDVESKLPEALTLKFIHCRPDERNSVLVALLKWVIPTDAQTVVFAGTQHHVELISHILSEVNISSTTIYSSMDPSARKINTAKFQLKKVSVLIVTDVAARGIDIPNLDYVINVHFPGKPKLFVHRVGRCARAGRHGTAYSICSSEDEAHLLDLHLFLNRPFNLMDKTVIGTVPQDILEDQHSLVMGKVSDTRIAGVYRTSTNAYKKYMSTRPAASADSNKRVKQIKFAALGVLDDFSKSINNNRLDIGYDVERENNSKPEFGEEKFPIMEEKYDFKAELLSKMRNYRPAGTVFELNPQQTSVQYQVMKNKRAAHEEIITTVRKRVKEEEEESKGDIDSGLNHFINLPETTDDDIKLTFDKVVSSKKLSNNFGMHKKNNKKSKKKKITTFRDTENYIPYQSSDKHTEDGLAINIFEHEARKVEFSVSNAGDDSVKHYPGKKKWDRIKKKMVSVQDPRIGKIRTESGIWIPATYKKGTYQEWRDKTKIEEQVMREEGEEMASHEKRYPTSRWGRHALKMENKKLSSSNKHDKELRNPEQIVKARMRLEYIKKKEQTNRIKKAANRKKHQRKQKQKGKK